MQRVNNITQVLAELAEAREKNTNPNIYEKVVSNEMTVLVKATMADEPERLEDIMRGAITDFVTKSFTNMLGEFAENKAKLLLEIKDQLDKFEKDGVAPDIVKIEKLGRQCASNFEMWANLLRAIADDIDFEHIGDRMFEVGKAVHEEREKAKTTFSQN